MAGLEGTDVVPVGLALFQREPEEPNVIGRGCERGGPGSP